MPETYQVYCEVHGADDRLWWRLIAVPFVPRKGMFLRIGGDCFFITFAAWDTERNRFEVSFGESTPTPQWLDEHGWWHVMREEAANA